jgi:glycosyltransferase involved in cell wall biosynthesis
MKAPRVAIVHYWLVGMRGGERVLEELLKIYPQADIFTNVYRPESVSPMIRRRNVYTTWINKIPGAAKHYQKLLPLMPGALESLNLTHYDLVISSESGPAKGVIAAPDAVHVCYTHSPMRYLWDHYHEYLEGAGRITRHIMPHVAHHMRKWDVTSATRVDSFVANSNFVRRRIKRAWGREATVVHPPVSVREFQPVKDAGKHYLWVSQMAPYKRADLAIEAFNKLKLPLLMIGDGEFAANAQRLAGPTVTVKPRVSFEDLKSAYANARALVFTPEEDFGIVPVEANASGRPVLAFEGGGALETVVKEETGLFFPEQDVESVIDGVERMEKWIRHFEPGAAIRNAERFAPERFKTGFQTVVANAFASA